MKWTGDQPVALRLGVIVFILHFKRVFELLIIEFSFSVDRRQKKCGLISTLVIALFRTSGFTVTLIRIQLDSSVIS